MSFTPAPKPNFMAFVLPDGYQKDPPRIAKLVSGFIHKLPTCFPQPYPLINVARRFFRVLLLLFFKLCI